MLMKWAVAVSIIMIRAFAVFGDVGSSCQYLPLAPQQMEKISLDIGLIIRNNSGRSDVLTPPRDGSNFEPEVWGVPGG